MTIFLAWLLAATAQGAVKQASAPPINAQARAAAPAVASTALAPSAVTQSPAAAAGERASAALPALEAWQRDQDAGAQAQRSFPSLYDGDDEGPRETVEVGGREFSVGRFLGKGETTLVHRLADNPDRALRRPSPGWALMGSGERKPTSAFIDEFVDGHAPLAEAGVPVVGIHDHKEGAYAEVDYLEGPLLRDFLRHPRLFSSGEKDLMLAGLESFAAKTAAFAAIGDFKPEQLMHDEKRGWVLFDWNANHERYAGQPVDIFANIAGRMAFENGGSLDADVRAWIEQVVTRARAAVARARKAG
jgi:hypothetical protein